MNLTNEPHQIEEVDEVRVVFNAWVKATEKHPTRTRLDDKRRRVITRALAAHPVEDVLDAVVGWRHEPFYCGENDRGRPFNDLGLLLRDAEHVERFRDLVRQQVEKVEARAKADSEKVITDDDGNITFRHYVGSGWVAV